MSKSNVAKKETAVNVVTEVNTYNELSKKQSEARKRITILQTKAQFTTLSEHDNTELNALLEVVAEMEVQLQEMAAKAEKEKQANIQAAKRKELAHLIERANDLNLEFPDEFGHTTVLRALSYICQGLQRDIAFSQGVYDGLDLKIAEQQRAAGNWESSHVHIVVDSEEQMASVDPDLVRKHRELEKNLEEMVVLRKLCERLFRQTSDELPPEQWIPKLYWQTDAETRLNQQKRQQQRWEQQQQEAAQRRQLQGTYTRSFLDS